MKYVCVLFYCMQDMTWAHQVQKWLELTFGPCGASVTNPEEHQVGLTYLVCLEHETRW